MRDAAMTLGDDRMLAYTDLGDEEGSVVIYCHGAPTSRLDLVAYEDCFIARDARFVLKPGQGHVSLIRVIPQLCTDLLALAKEAAR